jgi:RNA-directed DNA polymerase
MERACHRFAACKLVLHPEKTRIVYCKDANRRGDFPNQSFDFLGFSFRARKTMWQGILPAHGFMPAASPKALTAISRTIRRWTLHQRSDKSLQDLANMYNPYIGGWINYYGQFYRAQLRSTSAAYRWLPSPLGAPKVQAPARATQRHSLRATY